MENTNMNIPALSVNEMVELFADMYGEAIAAGDDLKNYPTPFLWGPPGVGKSEGVKKQLAVELAQKTGKKVVVTDVRLLLFSPVDLRGVPVADIEKQLAVWLRPKVFAMDPSAGVINILFLDELTAAPQSVQAAAYQICLDRAVGEHSFPDNCIVMAAGNRTTDRSISYKMPKALCNRLMHFVIESDYEEWKHWALKSGVDPRVIGYLAFDNSRLCVEPENSDTAYPSPRTWNYVSTLIKGCELSKRFIHHRIAGCVGIDVALAFEEWCRIYKDLPSVPDILNGRCRVYPRTHDALFALVTGIAAALYRKKDSVTHTEINNVCAYVTHFPPDFATTLFSDLNREEALRLKLMSDRIFSDWLRKHKNSIM